MKITFVSLDDHVFQKDEKARLYSLGQLSLAQIIEKDSRHDVEIISLIEKYLSGDLKEKEVLNENIKNEAELIINTKPQIVSIYTMCNDFHIALLLAKEIKEIGRHIKVILGGPQATVVAEETLRKHSYIDGIGLGEGERNILGIIDAFDKNDFKDVEGLAYRDCENIIVKKNENLIKNLDELPIIDFKKFGVDVGEYIPIDVGRGCPYGCIYCSTSNFWKRKFRIKSVDRIYKEIVFYRNNYSVDRFIFEHDMFVANRGLVLELCKKLIDNHVNIKWGCSARIDALDENLLKVMISAGCDAIFFGIESGSQRMQKIMNKNLDVNKLKEKISLISKFNIRGIFSFIYGFPQEEERDIEETLNLIKYMQDKFRDKFYDDKFQIQLHKLMYLPKTEVTEMHKKELVHIENFRMEIFKSIDELKDEELSRITSDSELFPNLCYVPTSLIEKTMNLDRFMLFVEVLFVKYNTSYNYLMKEYQNSLLSFYYAFINNLSMEKLNKYADERLISEGYDNKEYKTLKEFINNSEFSNLNSELLVELVRFEYNRDKLIHKKIDADNFWIKKFKFNVIDMIKNRNTDEKPGEYLVQFISKDKKAGIKYL